MDNDAFRDRYVHTFLSTLCGSDKMPNTHFCECKHLITGKKGGKPSSIYFSKTKYI